MVPKPSEMILPARLTNLLDLLRRQCKSDTPQHVTHPLLLAARRNSHNPLVQDPPQQDLARIDSVLLCELVEQRRKWSVNCFRNGNLRRIGGELDVLVFVVGYKIAVLEVRMILNLVDCRAGCGGLKGGVEVFSEVVAYADAFSFPACCDLLHGGPGSLEGLFVAFSVKGAVQEVQVHIAEAELFERFVKVFGGVAGYAGAFCYHVEFGTLDAGFFDGTAEFRFGVVDFGAVEMVVAHSDGCFDGVNKSLVEGAW